MKRFFFSLIALATVAASCTQSAVLDSPDLLGKEISFSPYTGRTPLTKAQSIEGPGGVQNVYGLAEAGGFNVYSFLHKPDQSTSVFMDGVNVKMENGAWTYDETMYWPDAEGYTLSFAAYSANAADYVTWHDTGLGFTYKVPVKVSEQVDLLATNYQSELAPTSANGGKVTMYFNHLLSRVGFKLVSTTNDESIDVVIKNVQLKGKFPVSGTVDLKTENNISIVEIDNTSASVATTYDLMENGAFIVKNTTDRLDIYATHETPAEVKKETEYKPLAEATVTANAASRYMMIIPHKVTAETGDEIIVTYQLTDGKQREAHIPLKDLNLTFEPCKAYEFILSISTKSISFNVEEYLWETNSDPVTNPLTPAETAIKITNVTENRAQDGTLTATVKAHVKSEQYESIVIQSFSDDGKWTDVTTSANYVVGQTDYTFDNIAVLPNRSYSFRIAAKLLLEDEEAGEEEEEQREMMYSATYIFYTSPTVETLAAVVNKDADELTGVYVTLNGEFPDTNGDLALESLEFRYSTSDKVDTENGGFLNASPTTVDLSISYNLSGVKPGDTFEKECLFAPNATYYYQISAKNNKVGTVYAEPVEFTTPVITPKVITGVYEEVGINSVKVKGTLESNGGNTLAVVGFNLSTDDKAIRFEYNPVNGTIGSKASFEVTATGLTANTRYQYWTFAENGAEHPYTGSVVGDTKELVTKAVATTTIVDYTSKTVILTIPDGGVGNATDEQGFLISTSEAGLATVEPKKFTSGNCTIDGLTPGTNYYVQAYVTNEAGTETGKVLSFTTKTGDESIPDWKEDGDKPEKIE